ncbi:DNA (cytosine-5-)-methyltransferase, partial [bacterium]|nr:DNA (cytosine-5-)-methyltransferase [bacterium]
QSFSYAGKKQGTEDPRGSLFQNFIELLEHSHPKMFLIENVKGLTSLHEGNS